MWLRIGTKVGFCDNETSVSIKGGEILSRITPVKNTVMFPIDLHKVQ
jgi:hypothetical protein